MPEPTTPFTTPAPADAITSVRDRLANAPKGLSLMHALAVFLVMDAIIVFALVGATSPSALPIVAPLVLILPLAIFVPLNLWLWWPTARRYPPQPQRPDAVVKLCQSFALSPIRRLNNCVHIAADDAHLHLIPFAPMRWTGARVISIPWSAIRLRSTKPRFAMLTATLGSTRISGPEWCMRLATASPAPDA